MKQLQERAKESESIAWKVRLLDHRPLYVYSIFAVALVAGAVGWVVMRSPLLAGLGFAMILGSTVEYWYGARFMLDGNKAQALVGASLSSMGWDQVKRVVVARDSVRLSPLASASTLDTFRGVRLLTTAENRDQVLTFIKGHVTEGVGYETKDSGSF